MKRVPPEDRDRGGHNNSVLSHRIRQRLDELDRGPGWLAHELGKHPTTVAAWLRGDHDPSLTTLREIGLVLHRPTVWLLGEDDVVNGEARPEPGN